MAIIEIFMPTLRDLFFQNDTNKLKKFIGGA